MQIMRQVHLMSIARNCFHEFGYELPISMSRYTIESLWELDQMRTTPRVSETVHQFGNETYEKAVKNAYLYYLPENEKIIQTFGKTKKKRCESTILDFRLHIRTSITVC